MPVPMDARGTQRHAQGQVNTAYLMSLTTANQQDGSGSRALHLVVPSRNTLSSHALPSVVPSPTVPREEAIRIVTEFERDGGTWGESSTIGRGVRYCPDDHLRLAM